MSQGGCSEIVFLAGFRKSAPGLIPDCNHTQHNTLSLSMGYNSAHVIIGDQSEIRFLTLSEASP